LYNSYEGDREVKSLFMGSLLICLLLVSTACEAIEAGDLEAATEFVTKLGELVDSLNKAIQTVLSSTEEIGDLEDAAKFAPELNEALGLMDETAQTVLSDTETLELPDSFKEQVESAIEAGRLVEDFMPFSDMAEEVLEESKDASNPILTPTITSIAMPMVLVGSKVALNPVAGRWGATGGENSGCSSKFRITKAGPWEQNDHFYVAVEFIDLEGEQAVSQGNYMSADFKLEWVVDMERCIDFPAPWCGAAVITVHDDILSADRLSEKYQVQVETLTFCHCP
jgi:hypothetical protein